MVPIKRLSAADVIAIRRRADTAGKQAGHSMETAYAMVREKGPHVLVEVPIALLNHEYDDGEMSDAQRDRVSRYAQMPGDAPPIYISFSGARGSKAYVSDGNHRVQVAKQRGQPTVLAMMGADDWNRWAAVHGWTPLAAVAHALQAAALLLLGGVREWADALESELGLSAFDVYESGNDWKLSMLSVPKGARKRGLGSKAMERLCEHADAAGKRVILTPGLPDDRHGTTSRSRLVRFYKRFGFVENKGRKKDFTISEGMYREPRS